MHAVCQSTRHKFCYGSPVIVLLVLLPMGRLQDRGVKHGTATFDRKFRKPAVRTNQDFMHALLLTFAATLGFALAGCDNKETVLEVETRNGEVEVQRDRETGDVDVEVVD